MVSEAEKTAIQETYETTTEQWIDFFSQITQLVVTPHASHMFALAFVDTLLQLDLIHLAELPDSLPVHHGASFFITTGTSMVNHGHFAMQALQFFSLARDPSIPQFDLSTFKNIVWGDQPLMPMQSKWIEVIWDMIVQSADEDIDCNHFALKAQTVYKETFLKSSTGVREVVQSNSTTSQGRGRFRDIWMCNFYQRPFPLKSSANIWRKTLISSAFASKHSLFTSTTDTASNQLKIVFLARGDGSAPRTILNKEKLIEYTRAQFPYAIIETVVITASLPIEDQMRVFGESDMLIGPHGSHMWNVIFCRPNSVVVEMQALWYSREFKAYAHSLRTNYFIQFYANAFVQDKSQPRMWFNLPTLNQPRINADFAVNEKEFIEILRDADVIFTNHRNKRKVGQAKCNTTVHHKHKMPA